MHSAVYGPESGILDYLDGQQCLAMTSFSRRQFVAFVSSIAMSRAVRGAPFVPARDPQVVAFAPGGTMVATGCSGLSDGKFPPRPHPDVRKCGVVAIWDVASRKRLYRWETFGDFTKLAFSPDGTLLAACRLFGTDDGVELDEVRLWDATSGRLVKALDRCHDFDFSPDGRQLAVLSRSKCIVYDLKDWSKEKQIKPLGEAVTIGFTADGLSLAGVVREQDKYCLRLIKIETAEKTVQSLALDQPYYTIAISSDGSLLATGHEGGNVVLWDAQTLDLKSRLQTGVRGLAHPFFSPDAKTIAAGGQETGDVVLWNLADRQEIARYTFDKGALRTYYAR
ncbi:MAG: WD40 repeat domain-containing protein, partial [Planctomycetia bacterium]|nr:WD40 repeat domain-containing protein [Planctomycetia bacterium]